MCSDFSTPIYLPVHTDRVDFLTVGGEGMRSLGALLYTAGGVLRLAPVLVFGRRFSGLVAIQPEHRLITSGLYGIIRHPSYLGQFVLMLGWGLAFRSGVGVVIAILSVAVLLGRIQSEERLLSEIFGAEDDAYPAHLAAHSLRLLARESPRPVASAQGLP